MERYITNEARSAELVKIISFSASSSRIIVLLKSLRHIIDNLKHKGERKERKGFTLEKSAEFVHS